jgi:serine/threonine-protein kinase
MAMEFKKALQSNRSICLLLMIAILAGMLFGFKPLLSLEYKAYDLVANLRHRAAGTPVVIVAIDDKSLKNIGDWPNGAHTQGISILYRSRELNDGLVEIQNLRESIHKKPPIGKKQTLNKIDRLLAQTQTRLNHDARLISAVKRARNVVLPLRFNLADADGQISSELSDWLKLNSIQIGDSSAGRKQSPRAAGFLSGRHLEKPIVASQVQQPYPELSRKSGALGHTNLIADQDMITRRVPLFVRYQNRDFFSLALQVAMKYFGAGIKNIRPTSSGLQLKHIHIPTIGHHQMLVDFNVRDLNIEKFSAVDVLEGKIPEKSFRHKIVLLGITAEEFTPTYKTPGQGQASGIEIVASAVENIINRKHISRPAWSPALEILVLIYFGFFLLFVIPKIQPRIGMLIFALFLATWIGVAFGLFISQGYWLRMVTPTLFAVIGLALVERRRISDKKKDESVELNKSLGLSLQGQGMLDMALERFMKCPPWPFTTIF